MKTLHLNLKAEYFDQIKAGEKIEEFRLCTPFWTKRLIGTHYDNILVKRGYPKNDDVERVIERPWLGFSVKMITHPHFGHEPVQVFAITVN